jgi:hypothetical protein
LDEVLDVVGVKWVVEDLGDVFVVPEEAFAGELFAELAAGELVDGFEAFGLLV